MLINSANLEPHSLSDDKYLVLLEYLMQHIEIKVKDYIIYLRLNK